MERLIKQERAAGRKDPSQEAAVWQQKIDECLRLRSAYQDQQAAGLMTLDELGSKLKELEETRQVAQAELTALEDQERRVRELEEDRDVLLACAETLLDATIDTFSGAERNKVYRLLRLEVTLVTEGYRMTGALGGFLHSEIVTSPLKIVRVTTSNSMSLPRNSPGR
jgi:hypothetical protein